MHPMFITLFIEADDDDFAAEENRRRVRRSRRARSAIAATAATARWLHCCRESVVAG